MAIVALVLAWPAMARRAVAAPLLVTGDLTTGPTATDLVSELLGGGVSVSNVVVTGAPLGAGLFVGGTGVIGFERGIVLGSGAVRDVVGPNDSDSTSTGFGVPGDADLNALIGSSATNDATRLEFDFVPAASLISFRYVFSSEEYNEYATSGFNDVFGFFVNGVNYALLPDNVTVVSINHVNTVTNATFFVNNDCSDTPCAIDAQPDGLTIVLTLTAPVNMGVPNHIKLAIADVGDDAYDSWVFIEGGSLTLAENCSNGIDDDGDLLVDNDDPDCQVCPDGNIDPGEECDDGNLVNCDGCNSNCTVPRCGDGVVCSPEACDPQAQSSTCGAGLVCSTGCTCTCDADTDCADQDPCNGSETCQNGQCIAGVVPVPLPAECGCCQLGAACTSPLFDAACLQAGGTFVPGEACDPMAGQCGGGALCVPPPSAMVSWWRAEDDAQDSVGGNHGTLSMSGVGFTTGKVGRAFSFDGATGIVTIADDASFDVSSLTLEAWVKPDSSGRPAVSYDVDTIFSNVGAPGTGGYALFVGQDPTNVYGGAPGPVPQGTIILFVADVELFSSVPVPNDGAYHHVAGSYDGTTMRVYLDGVLRGSLAAPGLSIAPSHPGTIGYTDGYGVIRYSKGAIDEVSFYGRALSDTEIEAIAAAHSAGKCTTCGDGVLDAGEACDDGNTNSGDGCSAGCAVEPCRQCSGEPSMCTPAADGSLCDDHQFCNGADTCDAGACALHGGDPCQGNGACADVCDETRDLCASPAGTACSDGNPCTDEQCDGQGACAAVDNTAACDDGTFCNGADTCAGGGCTLHAGDPCAAGGACADTCDEAAGSCLTPAQTSCPDDGNPCTADVCDGAGGCVHPPVLDGTLCSDGNACTLGDVCLSGTCTPVATLGGTTVGGQLIAGGGPVEVEVLPATAGFTSHLYLFSPGPPQFIATNHDVGTVVSLGSFPAGVELEFGIVVQETGDTFLMGPATRNPDGVLHAQANPVAPGVINVGFEDLFGGGDMDYDDTVFQFRGSVSATTCDDGNACTTDSCNPAVGCVNAPVVCDDGNPCSDDMCDPQDGCSATPSAPGTSCSDGVFCNGAESCDGDGACINDAVPPCPGTPCNTCQEDSDSCFDPAGSACDDGNPADADQCNGTGQCQPVPASRYAILRWGSKAVDVRIGRGDAIVGDVCADTLDARRRPTFAGDVVGMRGSGRALRFQPKTTVSGALVTGGGSIGGQANVIGASRVETDGSAAELDSCAAASAEVDAYAGALVARPASPGFDFGGQDFVHTAAVRFPAAGTLPGGDVIIETGEVRLKTNGTLTLAGDPTTRTVVLRIHGRLSLRDGAKIVLDGLQPEQVAFLVYDRVVTRDQALLNGTIISRGDIFVGRESVTHGQIVGSDRIKIRNNAKVERHPFRGWGGTGLPPVTPTPITTPTVVPTAVDTETPLPSATPTDTPTGVPTDTPTDTPTSEPTQTPPDTPTVTETPTLPAETPTANATDTPVVPDGATGGGTWSGDCGGAVQGIFNIAIGAGGAVTGDYSGSATGTFDGTISGSGQFDVGVAGGSAGPGCQWQGSFARNGATSAVGSGTWSCPLAFPCAGTWEGTTSF